MTSITKNVGINTLRTTRIAIEDHLAQIAIQLTHDQHTISAQSVRIAELEKRLKTVKADNQVMHDRLAAHAEDRLNGQTQWWERDTGPGSGKTEVVQASIETQRVFADQYEAATERQVHDRMMNVCRLATAAIRHCRRGNFAITEQLLSPLAGGQHDTYDYYENADNSSETRSECEQPTPYLFD